MLKIDDIMLHQNVIFNIVHMQLESPRHRHLLLNRKVDKMGDYFIGIRYSWGCLDGNVVGLIGTDGFFVDVGSSGVAVISHSYFLEGHVSAVELISDFDGGLKGNGHICSFERSIGF